MFISVLFVCTVLMVYNVLEFVLENRDYAYRIWEVTKMSYALSGP